MEQTIENTLKQVESDLKSTIEGATLCDLKTIRFDQDYNPDYSKPEIQQLYLLRYYPAYLAEYVYLYKEALKTCNLKNLSVLSIGCGNSVDYDAAVIVHNDDISKISYLGVDLIDWGYKNSNGNPKFITTIADIKDFDLPPKNDFNVIIFPKSLSEFSEESFKGLLQNISHSEFTEEKILLISSSMDKGFAYDESRYKRVMQVLIEKGYENKKYNSTREVKNKGWIGYLVDGFHYPDDIKTYIECLATKCINFIKNQKNCDPSCKQQLNKSPILNAKHISFLINLLER